MRSIVTLIGVGACCALTVAVAVAGAHGLAASCQGKPATIVARGPVTTGTSGDDVIVGTAGNDRIEARGGNDLVCAGAGDDTIRAAEGDDVLDAGPGEDACFAGPGAARLAGCERVGTSTELPLTTFEGTWDATYSDVTVHTLQGPCSDRTPRLARQGFYLFVQMCGRAEYIGNTTPISFSCAAVRVSKGCSYPFAATAVVIGKGPAAGSFAFTGAGGYPLGDDVCGRRRPGAWRIEVTGIDARGRISEFRWRTSAAACAKIGDAPLRGWSAFVLVTVARVPGT